MTTNTLQIPHNILGFLGFISRWLDQRQQRHADEKAIKAQLERENAERAQTEKLLFLKLLQTMVKVCEQLKPAPWVHTFGGWDPGQTVRALPLCKESQYQIYDATRPIFEINHESPRLHGGKVAKGSTNFYRITIERFRPQETIYNYIHCVSDDLIPHMQAVFDLAAHPNISSPERAATLRQLMDMNIPQQLPHQDKYPSDYMILAIQYFESLLSQNQSK